MHCSAGVGRTGTFISVDQICNNIDTKPGPDLDIFNIVYKLRKQRYGDSIQRRKKMEPSNTFFGRSEVLFRWHNPHYRLFS